MALVHTTDEYTKLKPGDEGVITYIDSMSTVSIKWDSGSTLSLIPEAGDRYRLVDCIHSKV